MLQGVRHSALSRARSLGPLLSVGIAYYLGAQLGLQLALYNSQVTPFWPPSGIAMAAMLLWGRRLWPAVLVAAFAVNAPLSESLWVAAAIAVGNVAAPVVAVTLCRRWSFDPDVARLRDAVTLVLAGCLSMTISAGVGTTALALQGLPRSAAASVAWTWWTGDTVGALLVAPFLLAVHQQWGAARPSLARAAEATVLLFATGVATQVGFTSTSGLRFLAFPMLATMAVRFQLRGAAPAALLASLLATSAAAQGVGGFDTLSPTRAMVTLSLFNACVTFTSYLLAALTADRQRAQAALAEQGDQLERLVDARTAQLTSALDQLAQAQRIARLGSYDVELATGTARWSDELYHLMQRPVGSPMGFALFLELCHPDEVEHVQGTIAHTVATGEPFTLDHQLRRPDGSYLWLHCQGQAVRDVDGRIVGTRGTAVDIDERKRAELRFQTLVELAPDAMVFVDKEGTIRQVNRQTETLFGWGRDALVGQQLETLIPERFADVHRHHRTGFTVAPEQRPMGQDLDLLARRRDGSEFPVEISLAPLDTGDGTLVAAAIRDVTDRIRQRDELSYRSLHDALTGLPNRVLLSNRLQAALASMSAVPATLTAVVFLDLDRFKWVNDSLGHDAGDTLLRLVAERLSSALRPADLVARFGGDEFVVVGHGLANEQAAVDLADRLRTAVSEPVLLPGGHTVVPTVSVGLTATSDPNADPADLLRDADAAMYRAKDHGRDRTTLYEATLHAELQSRLTAVGDLRSALAGDDLRAHFQPVLSLLDGSVLAVEALARWEHPTRGTIAPVDFIELAEETGQIGALDRAVIVRACRDFGPLLGRSPGTSLNVNVSLRHLSTSALQETLEIGLAQGGFAPAGLTVEITESADLSTAQFATVVDLVHALGARVAVDDFGTGFSALSRLNDLGVDIIKVDRSFVTEIHTSSRARAIVSAMVRLATALDAQVVAEGVEHAEQARVLTELGCEAGQGWLWSPALPVEQLGPWLTARAGRVGTPV